MLSKSSRFSIASDEVTLSLRSATHNFWLENGFVYKTHVFAKGYYNEFTMATLELSLKVCPFNTDLASIPWWIQWYLKKRGAWDLPSILHDYMMQHRNEFPRFSQKMIDRVFCEACVDQGVTEKERKVLYAGVRANSIWKGYK